MFPTLSALARFAARSARLAWIAARYALAGALLVARSTPAAARAYVRGARHAYRVAVVLRPIVWRYVRIACNWLADPAAVEAAYAEHCRRGQVESVRQVATTTNTRPGRCVVRADIR